MHVHLIDSQDRPHVLDFSSIEDAIRFKVAQGLSAEWRISDERPIEKIDPLYDPLLLIGIHLRDRLEPLWRAAQYDRLVDKAISFLPQQASEGMAIPTALAVNSILSTSGFEGWRAVAGRLKRKNGTVSEHAWLERHDGIILDLAGVHLGMQPVAICENGPGMVHKYVGHFAKVPEREYVRAETWCSALGEDVLSNFPAPSRIAAMEPEEDFEPFCP